MIFEFFLVLFSCLNSFQFIFQNVSDSDDGNSHAALKTSLQTEESISCTQVVTGASRTEWESNDEENATHTVTSIERILEFNGWTAASAKLSYISNVSYRYS